VAVAVEVEEGELEEVCIWLASCFSFVFGGWFAGHVHVAFSKEEAV
jgi:hypothetical protein